MTGMGKTLIYARINDGTFPKQIQLDTRSVVSSNRDIINLDELSNVNPLKVC